MNPELTQKLAEKYPVIFVDLDSTVDKSCMAFGIECGDGWYDPLDMLCETLTNLYSTGVFVGKEFVVLDPPAVVATQIKQKFGGLRFYYTFKYSDQVKKLLDKSDSDAILAEELRKWQDRYSYTVDGAIRMAETICRRTCEFTGLPGELHISASGWATTLNCEYAKREEHFVNRNFIPVRLKQKNAEDSEIPST